MDDTKRYSVSEANNFFARHYNGACWYYLAKDEPSTDDMAKMINLAHVSLGFDTAYAYMLMARASALIGLHKDAKQHLSKMVEAVPRIENSKDKEIFIGDLSAGPWSSIAGLVRGSMQSLVGV